MTPTLRNAARSLLLITSLALVAQARADVIEPPAPCAPWEDATLHHGTAFCTTRACRTDAQCSGGHCYNVRRVCVVTEAGPGGRGTRDREVGACTRDGACATGACLPLGSCHR
jgi:hypothetical protein